jgi:hypothetical protein
MDKDKDKVSFLAHYDKHIADILEKPSGQHGVDPVKLEEWIQAQHSETRREIARRLADQIVYVTFEETKELCKSLVNMVYKDLEDRSEKTKIVWWVGKPYRSGYFISILCYFYLKELGLPEPDDIIGDMSNFEETAIYLKWDDMSYSGSQLEQLNKDVVYSYIKSGSIHFPDIWHCLICATETATNVLQNISLNNALFTEYSEIIKTIPDVKISGSRYITASIPSPFRVYAARTFPSLDTLMGVNAYYLADLFFNLNTAKCIVYFDHKVADNVSTYMTVLLYGVVPPSKIKWDNPFIEDYLKEKYGHFQYPKLKETGLEEGIAEIQFKPFLQGCEVPSHRFDSWKSLPYDMFLQPYKELTQKEKEGIPDWDDPLTRCPFSWYKTAFRGGRRRNHRKTRRRRGVRVSRRKGYGFN